jgi:membrane peptidoglycan carboxypeptidase
MDAVTNQGGTGARSRIDVEGFDMAGKTGTTQIPSSVQKKWGNRAGVRDVWFAGITPNLVTTVWIGNDAGAPFPGSGSGNAGPVWKRYVSGIFKTMKMEGDLIQVYTEDNYVLVDICGDTGEILSESENCKFPLYKQFYYKGEEPKISKSDVDFLHNKEAEPPAKQEDNNLIYEPYYPSEEEDTE